MSKMQELYEKVAKDRELQAQYIEILDAEKEAGAAATKEKLIEFAKKAGFEVTEEEMTEFFTATEEKGELSDADLDAVAGGKFQDPFNPSPYPPIRRRPIFFTGIDDPLLML